jgi:choline/glycine/proline betaine transport protein
MFWMGVFGNSAIDLVLNQGYTSLIQVANENTSMVLFKFLGLYPYSDILSFLAISLVLIFFITSFDSGALVVDMIASNGAYKTSIWQRVYWSAVIAIVTYSLLLAGGLQALQNATISATLPFTIIILLACYGLLQELKKEHTSNK